MPDLFDKEQYPDYKRVDVHMLDPRSIKILPEFNGRKNLPPIDDLLRDFLKVGQLVNCIITKRDGEPVLLAGHRRWRAALKLSEEKKGPHGAGVFKLRCSSYLGTPMECFKVTLKENIRQPTEPEDDGYNMMKLATNFDMSEEDIAVFFERYTADGKPDVKFVQERMALASLAPESLSALKAGIVKPSAAVALAKLSQKVQRDKLKRLAEGEKLTVASLKRDATPVEDAEPTDAPPRKPSLHKPTLAHVKAMIQTAIDDGVTVEISKMSVENAVREVLGGLLDALN